MLRRYHPDGAQPRIPVWGPVGTAQRMAQAYGLPVAIGHERRVRVLRARRAGPAGAVVVEPVPVKHPIPTFGLRVVGQRPHARRTPPTPGRAPAWTRSPTESTCCSPRRRSSSGEDNPPDLHLTGADCGVAATRGGVGRLVVTHVPAWYDPALAMAEAKAQFAGQIDLAFAGAVYDV